MVKHERPTVRLYDGDADLLLRSDQFPDRVSLLPNTQARAPRINGTEGTALSPGVGPGTGAEAGERIRVLWGQDMLRDLLDGRYRSVICGVNDTDNTHGIVAQLVELVATSQWTSRAVTSFAKMFQESVSVHAANDREPYVLKFDLDSILVLALLRPRGRDYFTADDLARGFSTVTKMLKGRRERHPVASVSFLSARANRLVNSAQDQSEPSFESVLRTMYQAGFRGDVYAAPTMWRFGHVGVFPSYPFPESLETMREGGH